MSFTYTIVSLFEQRQNMPITHEQVLADLLRRYEEEREHASTPSPTLLIEAQNVLEQRLAEVPLDKEDAIRQIVEEAQSALTAWERKLHPQDVKSIQRFRSLEHNLGTPLYQARRYDLALPFFQKAVAYQTTAYYSYLWLAGCLWQTTRTRESILPLLHQAASRFDEPGSPWEVFRRLPALETFPFEQE